MSSNKKRDSRQYIVINEERLINEVQRRPILYDKALKGYRKPTIREHAWQEVATLLESSVDESKKRWRSLRDAFMKQYKQFASDEPSSGKKKKWLFYDQMEFLRPYLELNNEMSLSRDEYMDEYIISSKQELKREDYFSDETKEHIMKGGNVIIQHQIMDDDEEVEEDDGGLDVSDVVDNAVGGEVVTDVLGDGDVEEVEQLDDHEEVDIYEERDIISEIFTTPGIVSADSVSVVHDSQEDIMPHHQQQQQQHHQHQTQQQQQSQSGGHLIVKNCPSDGHLYQSQSQQQQQQQQQQHHQQQQQQQQHHLQQQHPAQLGNASSSIVEDSKDHQHQQQTNNHPLDITNVSPFGLDPDERFLLSCSPILKRLSHKKNALARLKMQQILYEIEFGDTMFG